MYLNEYVYAPSLTLWITNLTCDHDRDFKKCCLDLIPIEHLPDLQSELHHDLEKMSLNFAPQTKILVV